MSTGTPAPGQVLRAAACVARLALVLGIWLWPAAARAQAPAPIDRLLIEIRPEFDRPSVLVIYWITLAADTPLPASVSIPIPQAVGEPFAVGQVVDGAVLLAPYDRQVDGEWATITVDADSLSVQVEYYADLVLEGEVRRFALTWPGGVALGALDYLVQHPFESVDLRVTPGSVSQSVGADGLTYSRAELGPQAASAATTIELSYTKTSPSLTVEGLPASPPLEATGPTEGMVLQEWLPWVLGGLGALLLAGVGVWYWRSARGERRRPRTRRRRPTAERGEPGEAELDASTVFCHQCGAKAGVSDHFCRRCGTRLRQ